MPKIIDHDQRRRDIIEVAKRLIYRGGFGAATMRSIAAEAGFANGALKHYFPNKESIIAATFLSVLEELDPEGYLNATALPETANPMQRFREQATKPMPFTKKMVDASRILLVLWEQAANDPQLAKTYRKFLSRWRELTVKQLRDIRKASGAKPDDVECDALALELLSVIIGASVVSLFYPDGRFKESYQHYLEGYFRRIEQKT